MPGKLGSWHLLPLRVIERELKKYNKGLNKKWINPSQQTWPSRANGKWRRKKNNIHLLPIVIKAMRRDRWQRLKAELGQEYLERVHERSMKIPENPATMDSRYKMV